VKKRAAIVAITAGTLALLVASTGSLHADTVDPWSPRTLRVGAPPGPAPSERIDSARSGATSLTFPERAVELWRRQLAGGIDLPSAIDRDGGVIIAETIPEVVRLSADGKESYRVRIDGAPAVPPVITSANLAFVVTTTGRAVGIHPDGRIAFSTPLDVRGRDIETVPLARADGTVVVAAGTEIVVVDGDGEVVLRASLDARIVGAVLESAEGILLTTDAGAVLALRPPLAHPRELGSFGGAPRRGAMLVDRRTLVAVVEGRSLVALDLPTGTNVRLAAAGALGSIEAPAAFDPRRNLVLFTTTAGLLLGVDRKGEERLRGAVDPQAALGTPVAGLAAEVKTSPPIVVDARGRIAFARSGGRVGLISADGAVTIVRERLCGTPVSVLPAGPGTLIVTCHDGAVWKLGEEPETEDPAAPSP
jgi:hypothetical protein